MQSITSPPLPSRDAFIITISISIRIRIRIRIVVIIVEPAVHRFSHESEAFGSSFWRESVYVSSILAFWLFFRTSDSSYRWWGIAQPMDVPTEVTRWNGRTYRGIKHRSKHRFCYMARAGTNEHWNMLFFGKICIWRYVSPYYLLKFTTVAVDHDPNASLSCALTWKPLNCRLNSYNCY